MTDKEQYRQICEERTDIPLFLQHWWMDAVCASKNWDVLLYRNGEGEVQAVMPYLVGKKMWMRYVLQPQLTQFNGVWYLKNDFKNENERLSFEKKVCTFFAERFKELKLSYFCQNFSPSFTNWLPFFWQGYKQTTRYTYQIQNADNPDVVFANMDKKRQQTKILNLQDKYTVCYDPVPDVFYDFHAKYWRSRGGKELLPKDFVMRVCGEAVRHNQGLLAGLKDLDGNLVAAYFVAYDSSTAYALMSAYDRERNEHGMTALLVWNIIKHLSDRIKVFDFEGSMDENVEYSFRYYGTKQVPYFQSSMSNSLFFRVLLAIKKKIG